MKVQAPILFIAFNRPETTEIAFNRIREVKPSKLYVSIDGPRSNRENDAKLCKQVHEITKLIDWDTHVQYLVHEKNLGCRDAVVGAISWVLSQEDRVIIIEDDVVPEITFFDFTDNLLEYYKNEERIGMISGNNYTPLPYADAEYLFSRYAHIWGWATWKRVWDKFDVTSPNLKKVIFSNNFKISIPDKIEREYFKYWLNIWVKKQKKNEANAWGPFFFFFIMYNDYYSIVPICNLSKNIGTEGSHTTQQLNQHFWPTNPEYKLKKYNINVNHSVEYDKHHFKNHIFQGLPPNIPSRILNKLLRILNIKS